MLTAHLKRVALAQRYVGVFSLLLLYLTPVAAGM